MPAADRVHDLEVDAEQVVAAHARLAGNAGGDDDDVGAGDRRIVARAGQSRVDALNRGRFRQIQRLALRHAVDDVEKDDVAQLFHRRQERQRPADLAGPDQSYLLARHRIFSSAVRDRRSSSSQCGRLRRCYRPIDARDQAKLLAKAPKSGSRPLDPIAPSEAQRKSMVSITPSLRTGYQLRPSRSKVTDELNRRRRSAHARPRYT